MRIVIGTRGSKLALWQAEYVRDRLQRHYPKEEFVIKMIKTKGDRIQDKPLNAIGDKGLFVKEIEQELLAGEIQMAVHSMKDMPAQIPEGLVFAKAWKREDPRDVLVLREAESLEQLPVHAVIGTGSKRRAFQLLRLRPDLKIVDIRGNIDTRLEKLKGGELDGIVLAAAGLLRLGRESEITQYLSVEQMIPAATQGTLAIEMQQENHRLFEMVNALADEDNGRASRAERCFLEGIGGDCHLPIGAYATVRPNRQIELSAVFGNEDGSRLLYAHTVGEKPETVARAALEEIQRQLQN